ncbi:S8 family peptidase [Halalkalibacter urbisdiaboli]|uniref:S8 family peptidase n=1 Tax=Halalkalibacter urbisdiaboli TaxID=1960589 RepID=UPI000B43EB7C|nr:S8 family peptidase [Halalkalibacter urbisdiaboli]
MSWRIIKTVTILAGVALALTFIANILIEDQQITIQHKDIPQTLEASAMDKLTAEDLSMTTSMFIKQLSAQMNRWAEADLSEQQLKQRFEEELGEHSHFHGFAILENNEKVLEVGEMSQQDASLLSHHHMESEFSDPYEVDGEQYMLMGEQINDHKKMIGEINLSFVKEFVKDMASVADANGNFFVSGQDPKVQWETTKDMPEHLQAQTVPELGWQIVVHSKEQKPEKNQVHYEEQQAVIKFKHPETADAWFADHPELTLIDHTAPFYVVKSKVDSTETLIERLQRDYDLSFVEPNYVFTKQGLEMQTIPNDEFFEPYQWNLTQIEAGRGWNFSNGANVNIAILDTGVDPDHLDLKNKIKHGYNAFDDSSEFTDEHGHGTHVAGVAAALTNNVTGIAGVSWNSTILPVKVLDKDGAGTSYEVAKGIYWAVDHGAQVINMSLGDYYHADVLHEAIKYAYDHDVVLIAASGNDNVSDPMYPANYEEVLTVAAVDDTRNRAFFSNYGPHVDVTAPGAHIPSLFPDNNYVVMSGTSMASPHVAGLAGLIRALRPDLNVEDVYHVIRSTAKDLGTKGHDQYYGFGEVDVAKALESISE